MSQAQYVTATFSSYPLTVTTTGAGAGTVESFPGGIDCGATCSASFAAGSKVFLEANPTGETYFAGWSGACTGTSSSCTVPMS
jgi:hypothetical protein